MIYEVLKKFHYNQNYMMLEFPLKGICQLWLKRYFMINVGSIVSKL